VLNLLVGALAFTRDIDGGIAGLVVGLAIAVLGAVLVRGTRRRIAGSRVTVPQRIGSRARTRLPSGPELSSRFPPIWSTRSRIDAMPTPSVPGPGRQSRSLTRTSRTSSSSSRISTSAASTPACRATFVTA
jgi:hypothetical protein